mmetsp:Transcript_5724/g.17757  ORF Transcript_5724/g.17757 Transcript_5724/m.17757 type:complete len:235 (+) Transcript_5724:238-942(+)
MAPPAEACGSSARAVAKTMTERHAGSMRTATSAATAEMNPSTTATTFSFSASMKAPTIAAVSSPPSRRSASRGSPAMDSACAAHAARTVSILCARPASSKPVPRPQHFAASVLVKAARSAAADVVLPMPTSPTHTTLVPDAATRATTEEPRESASSSCAAVMAASRRKSRVPSATLRCSTSTIASAARTAETSAAMPTSTTTRRTSLACPKTAAQDHRVPAASARKIEAVTCAG